MTKTPKTFDAVELMRSLRDELSERVSKMTLAEELAYLEERSAWWRDRSSPTEPIEKKT
jgi:hypothetical protein